MFRLNCILAISFVAALFGSSAAFTAPNTQITKPAFARTSLYMSDEDSAPVASGTNTVERGVSIDQDGKSNVWAIEPKMEVESKSAEEKGGSLLIAGGGIAAFLAVAGAILANLPDPDQF